jgi:hypothetical protein
MPKKAYTEMTIAELRRATKQYDEEFGAIDAIQPVTAADRALHARARGKGRPRIGQGAERINLTIERGLLDRADAYAKAHKITRAKLVSIGLEAVIARKKSA